MNGSLNISEKLKAIVRERDVYILLNFYMLTFFPSIG